MSPSSHGISICLAKNPLSCVFRGGGGNRHYSAIAGSFISGRDLYWRRNGDVCKWNMARISCKRICHQRACIQHFHTSTAAWDQHEPSPDDTQRLQRKTVALIAKHLSENGDMYPSVESIHQLQKRFNIDSPDEARHFLTLARRNLKRRSWSKTNLDARSKSKVKECIERCIESLPSNYSVIELCQLVRERMQMEEAHSLYSFVARYSAKLALSKLPTDERDALTSHIEASVEGTEDETAILEDLERLTDGRVPRHALKTVLAAQKDKMYISKITHKHRQHVLDHVLNSPHQLNTDLLIEQLKTRLQIPRKLLRHLVRIAQKRVSLGDVSDEHRRIVNEHVAGVPISALKHPRILCNEMRTQVNLPKYELYSLVRVACRRRWRQSLTPEQRNQIKAHVKASEHGTISLLLDELQGHLGVNRDALHDVVRSSKSVRVSEDRRDVLRARVLQSPRPFDVRRICNEVSVDFPDFSKRDLYFLVRSCCDSVERKELSTPETRQFIEQYVFESGHPDNIPLLCDELHGRFGRDFSRRGVMMLVHDAVSKWKRKMRHEGGDGLK